MNSLRRLGVFWLAVALCGCGWLKGKKGEGSAAASASAAPTASAVGKRPADAVSSLDRAVAQTAKGAKEAKLDPKRKTDRAFLAGLQKASRSVEALKREVAEKGPGYDKALFRAAAAVSQLEASKAHLGRTNPSLDAGVKGMGSTLDALQRGSGKLGTRKKKGGPLADTERARLAKARGDAAAARGKVAKLRPKARSPQTTAELDRVEKALSALGTEDTLDAYLHALAWTSDVEGLWASASTYLLLHEPSLAAEVSDVTASLLAYDRLYLDALDAIELDASLFDAELELAALDLAWSEAELGALDRYVDGLDVDAVDPFADNDCDGLLDAQDPDDDNDGTPDTADLDDDGDGREDGPDEDVDDDGIPDDLDADDDNDGTPDAADLDDDNDGVPDSADRDDDDGKADGDDRPGADDPTPAPENAANPDRAAPQPEPEPESDD